jgi:hypothetical protein
MLQVVCSSCGAQGRAPEKLAGRTVPCPKCKSPLTVPELAGESSLDALDEPASKPEAPKVHAAAPARSAHLDDDEDDSPYRVADEPSSDLLGPKPGTFERDGGSSTFKSSSESAFQAEPKPKKRKKKKGRKAGGSFDWSSHDPRREPAMWLFALTLLPFLFFAVFPPKSPAERLAEAGDAVAVANEDGEFELPNVDAGEDGEVDPGDVRDFIKGLPDGRLPGAHLSADSAVHWVYLLAASLFFLGAVCVLFPTGSANPLHLSLVGLVTGTLGVFALLAFQWIAFNIRGFLFFGKSILFLLLLLLKLIAWSYVMGFQTDGPFAAQWFGFTFGVGLCEEFVKAAPLLFFINRSGRDLDWRSLRAWGLASGVGFGLSEAVHYAGGFYNGVAGPDMYVVRFISCVGLHAILTAGTALLLFNNADEVCGGEWYSMAGNLLMYLTPAMVMHGLFNTLVTREYNVAAFLVGVVSFLWMIWLSDRTREGAE